MLAMDFEGLCGFSNRGTGWDVYLPVCKDHPHTAVLGIRGGCVDLTPGNTTWNPDAVSLDSDGFLVCYWVLKGRRLLFSEYAGGGGACTWANVRPIDLKSLYPPTTGVKASAQSLGQGNLIHLPSGTVTGSKPEPVHVEGPDSKAVAQAGPLAGIASWQGYGTGPWVLLDQAGNKRITLVDAHPQFNLVRVTVTNAVPEFNATDVLDHFDGIYEALEDTSTTGVVAPGKRFVLKPDPGADPHTRNADEGVNCIPTGELP